MDDELKMELIRTGVPAIGVPLARAFLNHRMTMKQMENRKEMEIEVAEKKQEGMREMARMSGGGAEGGGPRAAVGPSGGVRSEPVGGSGSEGDVYDELESLKEETDCQFCHSTVDSLMDSPPAEARQGLDELRSFVREQERIEGRDISEEKAEQIVGDLVARWEVVPRHAAQMV